MSSPLFASNSVAAKTELAVGFTVQNYHDAVLRGDRKALGEFLVNRFEERYFRPMDAATNAKHGFLLLSLSCMVIETLEAFYRGMKDTRGRSKDLFRRFFNRHASFNVFIEEGDWFYEDIRCGLLHQGETRGGWKIHRRGVLLNRDDRVINASLFVKRLREALAKQAEEMQRSDECWRHFLEKMEGVCGNCLK